MTAVLAITASQLVNQPLFSRPIFENLMSLKPSIANPDLHIKRPGVTVTSQGVGGR